MLNKLTITKAHEGLSKKEFSCVELTQGCLDTIKKTNGELNSFITVVDELALEQAKAVDDLISHGEKLNPLSGIPYATKDFFMTRGIKTTCGSKILENYIAPYESTTTARLKNQHAVLLGKTNQDEFGMGTSGENSGYGSTKNPLNHERVPGGSSSGSAAAVVANQCIFALGTDTGGSIRQPASMCGVVGLKPTYGRTSRYGVGAMASSLDTIGCLAKTVEDSALVLNFIAGEDKHDATTSPEPVPDYSAELNKDISGLHLGIPKGIFNIEGLNIGVKNEVEKAVKELEDLTGNSILEVNLPHLEYALAAYYVIVPSEISSNLARYDGIKYGLSKRAGDLLTSYLETRAAGFGDEVKRRIMLGTYALSHGYYDAYYKQALKIRTLIKQDFAAAFEQVDSLIMPVVPSPAFKLGEKINDPWSLYLEDVYTLPINMAGLPGLSVPCGQVEGLPVNFQLIGQWFDEATILRVGHNYEANHT